MGIQGLLSYCFRNSSECMEFVDLVEIAEQRDGIEILVDFNSFMNVIKERFTQYLHSSTGNKYLMLIGSEYKTFDAYFTRFINLLRSAKITLVWFTDGGKGATKQHLDSKLSEWISRHFKLIPRLHDQMMVCAGQQDIQPNQELMLPLLHSTQMRATLKKLDCELIQCCSGEADDCIAKALIDRPNAFAILTNDSDFCIFDQCVFLPTNHFDMNDDLKLTDAKFIVNERTLQHLRVGLIISARLINHFKFDNCNQMIDLSIVKGNDYTKALLTPQFYDTIGLHRPNDIRQVAAWVLKWGCLEANWSMMKAIRSNMALQDAIHYSRQFYTFQLCDKPLYSSTNEYEKFIFKNISEKNFDSEVITMYNQFYWRRPIIEDPSPGYPCVEIALTPLRQFIYRMILPFGRDIVTEYGRAPNEELRTDAVRPYDLRDRRVPFLHSVRTHSVHQNLRTFDYIITHLEQPGEEQNFIQLYGRKNGFIYSLLRYFLLLNWNQNLCISREEFLALVAAVAIQHHSDETTYQRLGICPLPRTVTIASWFLDIYRHAYIFLGALLFVINEFPKPDEIFSGSIWIACHSCVDQQLWSRAMQSTTEQELRKVRSEMERIFYEKRNQIKRLTTNVFMFNGYL